METETMGQVTVEATIENIEDLWAVKRGLIPADQVEADRRHRRPGRHRSRPALAADPI